MRGNVYFIGMHERTGKRFVKIGWTIGNPHARMQELQVGNPYELTLLAVIPEAERQLEFVVHQRFDRLRVRGEWFRVDKILDRFIRGANFGFQRCQRCDAAILDGKLCLACRPGGHPALRVAIPIQTQGTNH
jgi:hypothetical protein